MNQGEILCLSRSKNTEIVTNYIVTERVSVGNKVFVLAENPDAPIPFITLEKTEEQAAYEKGRQFKKREVALEDLYTRAVKAAKAANPFPYQPKKYDCGKCSYRSRETNFCGFCMMKIIDEMTEQNEIKTSYKKSRGKMRYYSNPPEKENHTILTTVKGKMNAPTRALDSTQKV